MFDHFNNGAQPLNDGAGGQPCFPAIGGKVTVVIPEVEEPLVLPVIEGLRIQNAYEMGGKIIHELCGQPYKFIVTNLYRQVFTDEMKEARLATIIFAKQIVEAVESKQEVVNTIFGLKYLSWTKNAKAKPKAQFRSWADVMMSNSIKVKGE